MQAATIMTFISILPGYISLDLVRANRQFHESENIVLKVFALKEAFVLQLKLGTKLDTWDNKKKSSFLRTHSTLAVRSLPLNMSVLNDK